MNTRRHLLGLLLGMVCVVLAAVGVALANESTRTSGSSAPTAPVLSAQLDLPETATTGAELRLSAIRAELSVLRRSVRTSDVAPTAIANGPLLEDHPAVVDQARRVRGMEQAWLAPSSNGEAICVIGAGELACPKSEPLVLRGAAVGIFKHADTPWRVTGVATDDVAEVSVRYGDGQAVTAPVTDNYFSVETATAPLEVSWIGPFGREVEPGPRLAR